MDASGSENNWIDHSGCFALFNHSSVTRFLNQIIFCSILVLRKEKNHMIQFSGKMIDMKISSIVCQTFLLVILLSMASADRCCKSKNHPDPQYRRIKRNSRSTERILSQKQISSLEKCQDFAIMKKALAFNFGANFAMSRTNSSPEFNCQVLACPEINSFGSLVEDQNFDYYSIYSRKMMPVNKSVDCLPSVGIFVIYENPENFTNARLACEKIGAKLIDIVSEERNKGLAKFIPDKPTFVGLSNRGKVREWKNEFGEFQIIINFFIRI